MPSDMMHNNLQGIRILLLKKLELNLIETLLTSRLQEIQWIGKQVKFHCKEAIT